MTEQNTMPDVIYCSLWAKSENPLFLIGPWLDLETNDATKYVRADIHTNLLRQARDALIAQAEISELYLDSTGEAIEAINKVLVGK